MKLPVEAPHTGEISDLAGHLETDPAQGLSDREAARRLEVLGPNRLEAGKKVSPLEILWHNLNNIIVYLLILASVVSFVNGEPVEGFAVIVAILIAVLSGVVSEYQAQKSVESLQSMVKTHAKVRRDGRILEIASEELVPGDVLFLEEGDPVGADARLISARNFAVMEAALTGESEAVDKDPDSAPEEDTPLGDRKNMVYLGTAVTRGNADALVTGTAMDTEIGRISGLLKETENTPSPLEEQLDRLGKTLILFAGAVALLVSLVGILSGREIYEMVKIGIILAIAAVPEALPAVSTITLAIGMKTMAGHNALVKSLPAVETLGSTTVICTDKTGTLTENQMTTRQVALPGGVRYRVEGNGYVPEGDFLKEDAVADPAGDTALMDFITAGVLSSNASLSSTGEDWQVVGDPTEGALVVLGRKAGLSREELESAGWNRLGEIPFDSRDKYMATAYETPDGEGWLFVKGAPDVLDALASGEESLEEENSSLAGEGLRVLAVGRAPYRGDGSEGSLREALKEGIEILGLAGILDPPRQDVRQAIEEAYAAGIRVIMITGDHPRTASIIAERIGMENTDRVITGQEMDSMDDETLAGEIRRVSVFARVSPENKLQIIRALNIDKEVTAMTGDGVNDAPALQGADIGVAMGIRGTEVAREASDMILTDDRFSTIVRAVREGRVIFDNIEKFVYFLFSCNVVEILAVFLAIVLGYPMPVLALQILWMNLVVDVMPAMSLAWEPGEPGVMRRPPRDPSRGIVTRSFLLRVLAAGAAIGLGSLGVFVWALESGLPENVARTMSFTAMALGQLFHIFNARENEHFGLDASLLKNPYLLGALGISVVLQLAAVYLPFLNRVMDTVPLTGGQWVAVLAGAIVPTLLIQGVRALRRRSAAR